MSIFEYDEEKHIKSERAYAYNEGMAQGRIEGMAQGEKIGEQKGIRILTAAYLKEGIPKERILQVLKEAYSIDQKEAETYYEEAQCALSAGTML